MGSMMAAACLFDRRAWTHQAGPLTSILRRSSRLPFSSILAILFLTQTCNLMIPGHAKLLR